MKNYTFDWIEFKGSLQGAYKDDYNRKLRCLFLSTKISKKMKFGI